MIQLNNDICNRFTSLVLNVFGLSFDKYLVSNNGRSFFGYAIDLPNRVFIPFIGKPPCSLTDAMNTRFVDSIAGYKVDVGSVFPSASVNADVLLLSTELSSVSDHDFNSILLHEACHLIIDGNLVNSINFQINEKARYYGERLFMKTDYKNEHINHHSIEFCTLLAAAAQRYLKAFKDFSDLRTIIDSAMRYDLKVNARSQHFS